MRQWISKLWIIPLFLFQCPELSAHLRPFDPADRIVVILSYDASGNLTNVTDGFGATRQTFDAMNRLLSASDPFGQTVSNEYNLAGQRTRLVYPDGKEQVFAYDPAYRLTNTTASASGVASVSYAFDEVDSLVGIARSGGSSSFTRDPLRRIVGYSANNGTSNFIQRTLTRNASGFKTQEQIQAGLEVLTRSSSQTHIHNAADQIMDVYHNGPGMTVVPWYDANGNVTQVVQTVQLEAAPPLVFTSRYEYDEDNRLIAVESPLLTATYQYDGLGDLLQINEAGTIRRLVRDRADGLGRPLLLTDASGNAVQTYVWANGLLVAQVETGSVRYAHFNESGHLLALTDESGNVTDEFAYHPYGRLIARTGTTETPFAYMGAYGVMRAGYDLYLTRHRAYSANLMRFLQPDPSGLEGGWNLYQYGGGNPVSLIDVLGLCPDEPSWRQSFSAQYINPVDLNPYDPFGGRWVPVASSAFHAGQDIANEQYGRAALNLAQSVSEAALVRSAVTAVGRQIARSAAVKAQQSVLWSGGNAAKSADTIAEGMRISPYRVTGPGETFVRYESANPAFSKITPSGGVKPGTFAAPASDGFVPVGQRASTYNLPNPEIPRPNATTLTPPAGTPIIGPRPVSGGLGNEVIFWMGY